MLQISNITLHLGERRLFDGISTLINPGERVGLTGPNGAGKSTLLRVIAGEQQPDEGDVVLSGSASVGYLPQDGVPPDPERSVMEEVEQAFEEIGRLHEEAERLQEELKHLDPESGDYRKTLERFGEVQSRLDHSGAWTLHAEIERVLSGLGFRPEDFERPTSEFSGGWLMRIALAKLLLKKPTFLLLDEPTNHLDIESLQWLEHFLESYEGAIVVVSHDRAFLDSLTRRTLNLDRGELREYAGNYSFFEKKSAEEQELLRRKYENQQKELRQTEEFIERFRYKATKAKQVQSRIRMLEKLDRIELDDSQEEISFRFPAPERSGRIVMELKNVTKRYGEQTVFSGVDYQVERGDRIAVVGPNGAGKSTLIRILAGLEPVTSGERVVGYNVTPSYFAQHQAEELDLSLDVLEVLRQAAPPMGESALRTLLGSFLFEGDDVFKKVRVLSGGEKSRLALARMLADPGNFIILDEPTNHLDMQSKRMLQQALQQFEGTYMIVSHDRAFLDPIVNKTLEVQPGRIRTWLGNVSWYLEKRREMEVTGTSTGNGTGSGPGSGGYHRPTTASSERAGVAASAGDSITPDGSATSSGKNRSGLTRKEERRLEAVRRQELYRKVRPLKKRLRTLEEEIEQMEARKQEIETAMADPSFYEDADRVKETTLEYDRIRKELAAGYSKWEELAGRIEFAEQELDS